MPPVLGFIPRCYSDMLSDEWWVDGGRQIAGHETVVGDNRNAL